MRLKIPSLSNSAHFCRTRYNKWYGMGYKLQRSLGMKFGNETNANYYTERGTLK